jgi:uncharacterized membrane protein
MRWENTATIGAPVAAVWNLTVDVTNLPAITPTITRVVRLDDGPLRVGSRTRLKQPGQTTAVWTVTRIEPEREFTWQTKRMGLSIIGSHLLAPAADGCRNTLVVEVRGRGARLFGRLFGRMLASAIATENESFRRHAEASTQPAI